MQRHYACKLFFPMLLLTLFSLLPMMASADNSPVAVFTVGEKFYLVKGQRQAMDVAPYLKDDRAFLPVRFTAEAFGVSGDNIIWDEAGRKLTLIKGDHVVQLSIGSRAMLVNGRPTAMDVAPEIISGRIMLPLRYIAQALGCTISWDDATRQVLLFSEAGETVSLSDSSQVKAVESPAADCQSIVKNYSWRDVNGDEWTWQVPLPKETYQYYKSQPRIHERILKEYLERLNSLRQQAEEMQEYMEYWYEQCRVLPGDSYYEATQKYYSYMNAYKQAQSYLSTIQSEYCELQQLYEEAEYRQMLDGYVPYVTEEGNSELVKNLAGVISKKAAEAFLDEVEFAAAFVQEAIPYVSEEREYPRYPVETLVDGGDCEDKSILLAALLREMGYRTVLLVFDGSPGHMAVGVDCQGCSGTYYQKNGVDYYYLESTGPGWSIGEVPSDLKGRSAYVYVVPVD